MSLTAVLDARIRVILTAAILLLLGACGGVDVSQVSPGSNTSTASAPTVSGTAPGTNAPAVVPPTSPTSAPTAQLTLTGSPPTTAIVGQQYIFQPVASTSLMPLFSIQNKPSWASFESSTGKLSGTPTQSDIGTDSNIVVTASNGGTHASLASFSIVVSSGSQQSGASPPSNANSAQNPAPQYAAELGYTVNTFSSNFTASTVDIQNSGDSGYSWYLWNVFGHLTNSSAVQLGGGGTVTLAGDTTGPNGELTTATPASNEAGFVGTAFGGGAYIEAVFKFNPAAVAAAGSKGWPSFWSMALESSILSANHWPGEPAGYDHQIEVDIFEYLMVQYSDPTNWYGSTLHDWYGIYNVTCPPQYCQESMPFSVSKRVAPVGTDFTEFHRFGFLWVPATATTPGYARFYLDGQAMGEDQRWTQYTDQPAPPTNQPWAFGIIDKQHLMLILGTGVGEPMTVQSVNVWQSSAAANLHY